MWREIARALVIIGALIGGVWFIYRTGYNDAVSAYQREIALTTAETEKALQTTSHALSDASKTVEDADALDQAALKEIADEKASDACRFDAGSLRILDKIHP